jgi:uncharacterized protein YeeX (DUF496 family)
MVAEALADHWPSHERLVQGIAEYVQLAERARRWEDLERKVEELRAKVEDLQRKVEEWDNLTYPRT